LSEGFLSSSLYLSVFYFSILLADVKILAEKVLSDALEGATPSSDKRIAYSFQLNQLKRVDVPVVTMKHSKVN